MNSIKQDPEVRDQARPATQRPRLKGRGPAPPRTSAREAEKPSVAAPTVVARP